MGRFTGDLKGSYFVYEEDKLEYIIYAPYGDQYDEVKLIDILNYSFRPIENDIEDNNIDIDSIEELDNITPYYDYYRTINQLTRAVKQLNREIKELKERDV